MNYFFTFLLQALLPFSLLLGVYHSKQSSVSAKKIIWLSLFGFIAGIVLRLSLSTGQITNLIGLLTGQITNLLIANAVILALLIIFALCLIFGKGRLPAFWQTVLMLIAGSFWAKDPNITALVSTDVINTDSILHISAVIFAFVFCLCLQGWIDLLLKQAVKTQQKSTALLKGAISLLLVCLLVPLIGELLLILMKLQVLELTKPRLSFVAKSGEITRWLNYICAALLFVILAIFYGKIHLSRKQQVNVTQEPIEKRTSSHLLGWGYLALAITFATQLYWEQIASRPPQLSEAIPVTLDEKQQVHIPIEQVKDGKLHRFVWISDDGKAVRFFVINRQPDKLSLAAVFDACLLCGDQGYVMEGNQVVCVGCGVHMFIPSIGKPGGCNPVPIEDWQQTETEILINRTGLEEGLNLFSTIVEIDVKDPISGTQMKNTKTEHKYNYEGKTYFFESEKNLDLFRDNPEKYLGKGE